jgi:hypothetical protein
VPRSWSANFNLQLPVWATSSGVRAAIGQIGLRGAGKIQSDSVGVEARPRNEDEVEDEDEDEDEDEIEDEVEDEIRTQSK